MTIPLSAEQAAELKRLHAGKHYPEMYGYLGEVVSAEAASETDPGARAEHLRLITWLGTAKAINADDKSLLSEIVRGSMRAASLHQGIVLTDEGFQIASDKLAEDVGRTVLTGNSIPAAQNIIEMDVNQAVQGLNLEPWQWAGTGGDLLPPPFGLGKNYQSFPIDINLPETVVKAALQNAGGLRKYLRNSLPGAVANQDAISQGITDAMLGLLTLDLKKFTAPDSLRIEIDSDPIPTPQIPLEGAATQRVQQGHVTQSATNSISLGGKELDRTDFLSTQIASLATGGIRPGEVQIDPNVRPNEYLQQSFIDKGDACTPTERLQNSLILNNLGAQTTNNVYVDPLLLDLSGNGVQMTSITEGTVFDIDNSGTVKRTGWAGPGTGLLVLGDEGGLVRHGGQLVSEYLGGVQGKEGLAGEARFTDAFAALASLDSNSDGVINTADAQWQQLKVWADDNRNGISEPGELKSLGDWAISKIGWNCEARSTRRRVKSPMPVMSWTP